MKNLLALDKKIINHLYRAYKTGQYSPQGSRGERDYNLMTYDRSTSLLKKAKHGQIALPIRRRKK
jgi:hypothetical protein